MLTRRKRCRKFQSAPPVKGATTSVAHELHIPAVSIRAPREGGDSLRRLTVQRLYGFNPRPP